VVPLPRVGVPPGTDRGGSKCRFVLNVFWQQRINEYGKEGNYGYN
jgi:hypothetical protein